MFNIRHLQRHQPEDASPTVEDVAQRATDRNFTWNPAGHVMLFWREDLSRCRSYNFKLQNPWAGMWTTAIPPWTVYIYKIVFIPIKRGCWCHAFAIVTADKPDRSSSVFLTSRGHGAAVTFPFQNLSSNTSRSPFWFLGMAGSPCVGNKHTLSWVLQFSDFSSNHTWRPSSPKKTQSSPMNRPFWTGSYICATTKYEDSRHGWGWFYALELTSNRVGGSRTIVHSAGKMENVDSSKGKRKKEMYSFGEKWWTASYGPWATYGPPCTSANKVLLEHKNDHLFTYYVSLDAQLLKSIVDRLKQTVWFRMQYIYDLTAYRIQVLFPEERQSTWFWTLHDCW